MQPFYDMPDAATVLVPYKNGTSKCFRGFLDLTSNSVVHHNEEVLDGDLGTLLCSSQEAKKLKKNMRLKISVPLFGTKGTGRVLSIKSDGTGESTVSLEWFDEA